VDSRTRHLSNQLYLRAEQAKVIIQRSILCRPMRDAKHAETGTFITIIAK